MDINTPRGQESLAQERRLIKSFAAVMNCDVIETDKNHPAKVDGFLVKDYVIVGVFESKCRKTNVSQMNRWGAEWLLTHQKLLDGVEVSKLLCVPFYGVIYLLDEPIGVFIKLTDEAGNLTANVRVEETRTQATINGGTAVRKNAFIDLSTSYTFPIL